ALGDGPVDRCALRSFPTRRSSDLIEGGLAPGAHRSELLMHLHAGPQSPPAHLAHGGRGLSGESLQHVLAEFGASSLVLAGVEHRSEEHTSELQSRENLVCRLLLEK